MAKGAPVTHPLLVPSHTNTTPYAGAGGRGSESGILQSAGSVKGDGLSRAAAV